MPQSLAAADPRQQEEMKKDKNQTSPKKGVDCLPLKPSVK